MQRFLSKLQASSNSTHLRSVMEYDWQCAVDNAEQLGSGSAPLLGGFGRIKFFIEDDKLMLRRPLMLGRDLEIKTLADTLINSIHVLGTAAKFTGLSSYTTTVIEEFTDAIIRGDIELVGKYTCANRLGERPSANAKKVMTTMPVPIKVRSPATYFVKISRVKVTREESRWNVWTAYILPDTSPGEGKMQMETPRVYMCGATDEDVDSDFFWRSCRMWY